MSEQPKTAPRPAEQEADEQAFQRAGHRAEDQTCPHAGWDFDKHGRHCPRCRTIMLDFGD